MQISLNKMRMNKMKTKKWKIFFLPSLLLGAALLPHLYLDLLLPQHLLLPPNSLFPQSLPAHKPQNLIALVAVHLM